MNRYLLLSAGIYCLAMLVVAILMNLFEFTQISRVLAYLLLSLSYFYFANRRWHTELRLAEEKTKLYAARAEALLALPKASEKMTEKDFMQFGQELAENLTQSQIAFIHFVNDEQSIELVTWSKRTLDNYCKAVFDSHYPVDKAGIWADSLRHRKPVVFNDYQSYPSKKGLPEGHAVLNRLISVPVIENDQVVMITGVGNKDSHYTETDIETVQLISNEIWRIVQRRRLDIELKTLAQVIEQSPESIIITNRDGLTEYVNQACCDVSGYSFDEWIGQKPNLIKSGQTPQSTFDNLWESLLSGNVWFGEFYNQKKNGEYFTESAKVLPIKSSDGEIRQYVAIKEDITEKKALEKQLEKQWEELEQVVEERTKQLRQASEVAEAANEAKSTFLANMSHEIRTPLNAIVGFTHLIEQGELSELQQRRLSRIQESVDHLLIIINDILDISKIEAGKIELEKTDFSVSDMLNKLQSLLQNTLADSNNQLIIENLLIHDWFIGDQTRIRQALLNFLSNAMKFTENGKIIVRVKLQDKEDQHHLIRFEVEDTGIGIAEHKLNDIFTEFTQADASTTRKYGGTGLGLSITQRLIQRMGGTVGVSSALGIGSTFWFSLPLALGTERSIAAQVDRARVLNSDGLKGKRALVVEDNEINLEVAVDILEQMGLVVTCADNGLLATTLIRDYDFDIVLMDVQMPQMDGLEATQIIKTMPEKRHIPILAMTANVFEEDQKNCLAAGMVDFIPKPFTPDLLLQKLSHWLSVNNSEASQTRNAPSQVVAHNSDSVRIIDTRSLQNIYPDNPQKQLTLLQKFASQLSNSEAELQAAIIATDHQQSRFLAHKLKSSSRAIGALVLADLCLEIEMAAKDLDTDLKRFSVLLRDSCQQLADSIATTSVSDL